MAFIRVVLRLGRPAKSDGSWQCDQAGGLERV